MNPYEEQEFDKLTWPVHTTRVADIPRLVNLPHVKDIEDHREVAYLVYMYDKNSPFREEPDLDRRRQQAAIKAEFDLSTENLTSLFELRRRSTQMAMVSILRAQHDMEFSAMITLEHLFFNEYTANLLHPLPPMDEDPKRHLDAVAAKGKLLDQLSNMIEKHRELTERIFGVAPDPVAKEKVEKWTASHVSAAIQERY